MEDKTRAVNATTATNSRDLNNGTAQPRLDTLSSGISIRLLGLELFGRWYNMYRLKKDINPALSKIMIQ